MGRRHYRRRHIGDPLAGIKAILVIIGIGAIVETIEYIQKNPYILLIGIILVAGLSYIVYKLRNIVDVKAMIKIIGLFAITVVLIKWWSLIIVAIVAAYVWVEKIKFENTIYSKESCNGFWETILDIGKYGEYLTCTKLEKLEGNFKIVANAYVPKEDGEDTEIDLVMIHEKGIFVIESKNYSGWIYGNEKDKNWTATYNRFSKTPFYNPIWQNESHIKWLEKLLDIGNEHVKSIIVFSERCNFKNISYSKANTYVLQRQNLLENIRDTLSKSNIIYNAEQIQNMYWPLKRCTYKTLQEKQQHIDSINMYKESQRNINESHKPQPPILEGESIESVETPLLSKQNEVTTSHTEKNGVELINSTDTSHIISAKLYMKYNDEHLVAKERGLTPMTVQNHIVQAYNEGFDFGDIQLVTEEHKKLILEAIEKVGEHGLKAVKAELPEKVGYLEIKIVMSTK